MRIFMLEEKHSSDKGDKYETHGFYLYKEYIDGKKIYRTGRVFVTVVGRDIKEIRVGETKLEGLAYRVMENAIKSTLKRKEPDTGIESYKYFKETDSVDDGATNLVEVFKKMDFDELMYIPPSSFIAYKGETLGTLKVSGDYYPDTGEIRNLIIAFYDIKHEYGSPTTLSELHQIFTKVGNWLRIYEILTGWKAQEN